MIRRGAYLLALMITVGLSACAEDLPPPPIKTEPSFVNLSRIAPPPPLTERTQIPRDPRKEIWRSGYWEKHGDGFTWVRGTLMPRPAVTATWRADVWIRHDYGWGFQAGHWE